MLNVKRFVRLGAVPGTVDHPLIDCQPHFRNRLLQTNENYCFFGVDPDSHRLSHCKLYTSGQRNGTFNTIQYDGSPLTADSATDGNGSFRSHAGGGLFRSVTYTAASVQLQNLLALAGDTDGDRDIDLGDYTRLATNFAPGGSGLTWTDGDFDSDGDVDLGDYNSLASNFAPGGYGPAAVPEPATALLALLGMLVTCLYGRRPV